MAKKKKTDELKLDFGCGPNKLEGFTGVDRIKFKGVDIVWDATVPNYPFEDKSVTEINASHFIEHLTAQQRVLFFNECDRILKPEGKITIICPYWGSTRAYGDPTHQWPPISEMFFTYLNRKWRLEQAPHTDKSFDPLGYDCNFETTWGYGLHPMVSTRNQEFQQFAVNFYKEAAQDIHATLIKRD